MIQKLPRTIKELLVQGEDDGFLVQEDILLVYAEPEKHVEEIDEFFLSSVPKAFGTEVEGKASN